MRRTVRVVLCIPVVLMFMMPAMSGCNAVASYLLYKWIEDEFDKDREAPLITRISVDREEIHTGDSVLFEVEADDKQDSSSELEYYWVASAGTMVEPTSRITVWIAPDDPGEVTISVKVEDTDGNEDSAVVTVDVLL